MGIITRASGTPYVDGDTLPGARLEGDISTIYAEFNGNVDSANIKSGAVTLAKLASASVDQSKLVSGAATASNHTFNLGPITVGTGFTDLASVVHSVGSPAGKILLVFSVGFSSQDIGATLSFRCRKDGADMLGGYSLVVAQAGGTYTFMWYDDAPTAGASHTYVAQAIQSTGSATATSAHLATMESRR